jgi:hypothetical protein
MTAPTSEGQQFWNEFSWSKEELIKRFKKYGYNATIHQIVTQIKDHFPFMKYWIPNEELDKMFQDAKDYKPEWVEQPYKVGALTIPTSKLQYKGKPLILKNVHGDYLKYNLMVEWFAEHVRLSARRHDQLENVLTWYQNHTKQVVKHCASNYKQINAKDMRESIYRSHYECTEFRVTHICAIIDMWKPKRILDFSAGRGARLIGAMARDDQIEQYVGVDPDPNVHPVYEQMINRFAKDHGKFIMIQAPFESDEIDVTQDYDLVFTSPPYFDLEIYNPNDPNQSCAKYPTVNKWLNGFMFPSLHKAWKALKPGGRLALILSDPVRSAYPNGAPKYTERVVKFCHTQLKNCVYEGVLAYAGFEKNKPRSPQPIWVWQKGVSKE